MPRLDLGVHSKVYLAPMALKVSDVAQAAGVSSDAVRFYEKEGLLPSPPRSPAGYRGVRRHGTSTHPGSSRTRRSWDSSSRKIAELLEIQDKGTCPCGHTKTMVERRLAEIDAEIGRLTKLRSSLASMAALECSANHR